MYDGGSSEFFLAVLMFFMVLTAIGIARPVFMWVMVRALEGFANGLGRFVAWFGLIMVLQQILIIFLPRIFRVATIAIGVFAPFGYALINPSKAPAVASGAGSGQLVTRSEATTWFLIVPVVLIGGLMVLAEFRVIGNQDVLVNSFSGTGQGASLRTNVRAVPSQHDWSARAGEVGRGGGRANGDCGGRWSGPGA